MLFLLLACTGTADVTDSKAEDTEPVDSDTGDGVSPVVVSVTAQCLTNTDDQGTWFATFEVTDPQGNDTLDLGVVLVYPKNPAEGGDSVESHNAVCSNGVCQTSWEDNLGVGGCDKAGSAWLRVTATDEDGNVSAAVDYQTEA